MRAYRSGCIPLQRNLKENSKRSTEDTLGREVRRRGALLPSIGLCDPMYSADSVDQLWQMKSIQLNRLR